MGWGEKGGLRGGKGGKGGSFRWEEYCVFFGGGGGGFKFVMSS